MSFICAQSRKGESVRSRQRRKSDYLCLDRGLLSQVKSGIAIDIILGSRRTAHG